MRGGGRSREARARLPVLAEFLGAYLHQDWPLFSASPEAAVGQAIAESSDDRRRRVQQEVLLLLRMEDDDSRLRSLLNRGLGVNVQFPRPIAARAFVEDIRRQLASALDKQSKGTS